jgi:hypothetical protein
VHLPERRLDDALRDGVRLPAALTQPLVGAFAAVVDRTDAASTNVALEPQPIAPGTLGRWSPGDLTAEPA